MRALRRGRTPLRIRFDVARGSNVVLRAFGRAAGFVVRAWGVANEELMRAVVNAGADGMTVNFPDKLIAYLQGSGGIHV